MRLSMGSLGTGELLVIVLIALVIMGGPRIADALTKAGESVLNSEDERIDSVLLGAAGVVLIAIIFLATITSD